MLDFSETAKDDPPGLRLSNEDLERVVAGKEGSFSRKVLWALWSSSGFNPKNNESWRNSSDPPPIPPTPTPPPLP
jgi:hypothetical protein